MFENRDCAHCLFAHTVEIKDPYDTKRFLGFSVECKRIGKVMREEDSPKNSCWKFARTKNFPSKEEQIKNLWRNRLGRRIEKMSFVSLVALVLSVISLTVSLNLVQLIKQWLNIS